MTNSKLRLVLVPLWLQLHLWRNIWAHTHTQIRKFLPTQLDQSASFCLLRAGVEMSIILVQPRFEHSLTLFGPAAITASLSCRLSSFAVSFASSMFFLFVISARQHSCLSIINLWRFVASLFRGLPARSESVSISASSLKISSKMFSWIRPYWIYFVIEQRRDLSWSYII